MDGPEALRQREGRVAASGIPPIQACIGGARGHAGRVLVLLALSLGLSVAQPNPLGAAQVPSSQDDLGWLWREGMLTREGSPAGPARFAELAEKEGPAFFARVIRWARAEDIIRLRYGTALARCLEEIVPRDRALLFSLLKKGDCCANLLISEQLARLGLRGDEARSVSPYLLEALEDNSHGEFGLVYVRATMLLVRLSPPPSETMPRLVRLLASEKEPPTFACAAYAVRRFAPLAPDAKQYVPGLIKALRHDGSSSSGLYLGFRRAKVIDFAGFEDLLAMLDLALYEKRDDARGLSLVPWAVQIAGPGRPEEDIHGAVVLGADIEDPLFSSPSPRELIEEALVQIGAPASADLLKSLDDPDLRTYAALALSRIRPTPRETVPRLIQWLKGDDPSLVPAAAQALGNIGLPDALPALGPLREIVKKQRDVSYDLSWESACAVAKLGDVDCAIAHLRRMITGEMPWAATSARPSHGLEAAESFRALLEMGPKGVTCINVLAKHEDWEVRFLAQVALRAAGARGIGDARP